MWHSGGSPVASPCSGIQDLKTSRRSWGIDALGTVVVEVELHSGIVGVGLSTGGAPATFVVEEHLARFVEGQDVHNIELIWESMFTASSCHGSKGLSMNALSAIDLALWDALGKVKGEPVYNLLGGKTKDA
jgi:L-rhamnonate dehydratase